MEISESSEIKRIEIYKKDESDEVHGDVVAVLTESEIKLTDNYGAVFYFEDRVEVFGDDRVNE